MAEFQLAAQLYTVRDFIKTADGLTESLRKIHDIGYRAVQLSAVGPLPPEQIRDIVRNADLVVCNTHESFDRLKADLPAVVAEHRMWDCRHVAIGGLPQAYRANADTYRQFAREADEVGKQLKEAGLTFSYHNHAFELQRFPAAQGTALDLIYAMTNPAYVQAEIDTYWIQFGGGDPTAWIRKVSGRMPVVHLKDMVVIDNKPEMAEVGEGNLNWPSILDACREGGVEWYAVEQDRCQRDPFESLAMSYRNLQSWGLR